MGERRGRGQAILQTHDIRETAQGTTLHTLKRRKKNSRATHLIAGLVHRSGLRIRDQRQRNNCKAQHHPTTLGTAIPIMLPFQKYILLSYRMPSIAELGLHRCARCYPLRNKIDMGAMTDKEREAFRLYGKLPKGKNLTNKPVVG